MNGDAESIADAAKISLDLDRPAISNPSESTMKRFDERLRNIGKRKTLDKPE